jgi:branched-chain amino acid transport system substrate-binding protein
VIGYAIGWGTTISKEPYVPKVTGATWESILRLEAEWKKRNGYT